MDAIINKHSDLITNGITFTLYLLIVLILWMLFSKPILHLLFDKNRNKRFRSSYKDSKPKGKLYKHIELLLTLTLGFEGRTAVYSFYVLTVAIFTIFTILLKQQSSVAFNMIFSLLFALMPYGYLVMKLRTFRVEGSFEGERMITELLNQYKINYLNMLEAIDKSIVFLDTSPYTQKLLFRLSLQLKEYKKEEDLQQALKEFTYGVQTEWIKMLSNNIYLAVDDGVNVTVGLDDILKELRQAKSTYEENKRVNSEGFAIIKFLTPIMYLGSIYVAIRYFDFTLPKFFNYQFYTATGFRFFVAMVGLTIVNIGIIVMFKKKVFDF